MTADPTPGRAGPGSARSRATRCSERWRSTFLATVPREQTRIEVDFLRRTLPLDTYPRVLDLACGAGRHAVPLAEAGYDVTGVDADPEMLAALASVEPRPSLRLVRADMRELASLDGTYDAVICMWQSFGYFDPETNRRVLAAIHDRLRPGGRLVLDIYHRDFFETRQGTLRREWDGVVVDEHKKVTRGRLSVTLEYVGSGDVDRFEWQLYAPDEIVEIAEGAGFGLVLRCRGFDESKDVSSDCPRMQLAFQRI